MLKGKRTVLFGTAITILGVVELYVREVVSIDYQGHVLMGIGIAVVILRAVTTTPLGVRD